jgi:nanoRNase/pAp phosphatase (c-di-AMP/oligoRNAs hydrolase)
MDKPTETKLFDAIKASQRILIALPTTPHGDTLGSSLAFASFLKKLNKQVEIYCETKDFGSFNFLSGISEIKNEVVLPKSFVIQVNTEKTKIDEISYHPAPGSVNIYLKPKGGVFTPEDISFGKGSAGFDLILLLDTPSLEHLGAVYSHNAEIFFDTPKVNIDNHINNENYGNINIVDITSASTAEIVYDIMKNYEASLIDKEIATALLTGIIAETNSFQRPHTTPNSFMKASELIAQGANQQEIIQYLFKTKNYSVLKLWGRAMARIVHLTEFGTIFSVLSKQDIERSGATELEIPQVFDEFVSNVTDARLLFLFIEREGYLDLYVHAHQNVKTDDIVHYFGGNVVSADIGKARIEGKDITEAEAIVREALQKLRPALGL